MNNLSNLLVAGLLVFGMTWVNGHDKGKQNGGKWECGAIFLPVKGCLDGKLFCTCPGNGKEAMYRMRCCNKQIFPFKCGKPCDQNLGCERFSRCATCRSGFHADDKQSRACETCQKGWVLGNGKCNVDVNECSTNNGGCEHICVNSVGSFQCQCNPGFQLLPDGKSCKKPERTIVTKEGSFPWVASVQFREVHECGGALIHNKWIITHRGCVNAWLVGGCGTPNECQELSVVMGAHDIGAMSGGQPTRYSVKSAKVDFYASLILIELTEDADVSSNFISNIDLFDKVNDVGFTKKSTCIAVGWDSKSWHPNDNIEVITELQQVPIYMWTARECSKTKELKNYRNGGVVCAPRPTGIINAFQGGPWACLSVRGIWKLVGIEIGSLVDEKFDKAVNIANAHRWIERSMAGL